MLIALYYILIHMVLPLMIACIKVLMDVPIIVVIVGIVILLSSIGINLGTIIIRGISKGINYLCRTLLQSIEWIILSTLRLLPRVFNRSKNTFTQMGLNPLLSNSMAVLTTVLTLIIII